MGFINIDVQHFRGFKDLKIENLKQINLFWGEIMLVNPVC